MAYVGGVRVNANGTVMPVGSTLFGVCNSTHPIDSTLFLVTCSNFDILTLGVTIHVKFLLGYDEDDQPYMKVNTTDACPIANFGGDIKWAAGAVLSFTYDGSNWAMNDHQLGDTASVEQSYISTSRAPISGRGVADALTNYAPKASPAFTGTPTAPTRSTLAAPNNQIATTAYVANMLQDYSVVIDSMRFMGVVNSNADMPVTGYKQGWTYRAGVEGVYAGTNCEAGDIIMAVAEGPLENDHVINEHWVVIQANLDGAVIGPQHSVHGNVAVFNGATGKIIMDSGMKLTDAGIVVARYGPHYPKIAAYTSHTITGTNPNATKLATVNDGWLSLAPGILFGTTDVIDDIVEIDPNLEEE